MTQPRGKTTPKSNTASFAPAAHPAGPEVALPDPAEQEAWRELEGASMLLGWIEVQGSSTEVWSAADRRLTGARWRYADRVGHPVDRDGLPMGPAPDTYMDEEDAEKALADEIVMLFAETDVDDPIFDSDAAEALLADWDRRRGELDDDDPWVRASAARLLHQHADCTWFLERPAGVDGPAARRWRRQQIIDTLAALPAGAGRKTNP